MSIVIYTDGSHYRGLSGWAFVVVKQGKMVDLVSGAGASMGGNRAELTACVEALSKYPLADFIYSDSQYVVTGHAQLMTWRRSYYPKDNIDLWTKLDKVVQLTKFKWIEAHSWAMGAEHHKWNTLANDTASAAARHAYGLR